MIFRVGCGEEEEVAEEATPVFRRGRTFYYAKAERKRGTSPLHPL